MVLFFPTAFLLTSFWIAVLWPQQLSMKLIISLLLKNTIGLQFFSEHKLYGFPQSENTSGGLLLNSCNQKYSWNYLHFKKSLALLQLLIRMIISVVYLGHCAPHLSLLFKLNSFLNWLYFLVESTTEDKAVLQRYNLPFLMSRAFETFSRKFRFCRKSGNDEYGWGWGSYFICVIMVYCLQKLICDSHLNWIPWKWILIYVRQENPFLYEEKTYFQWHTVNIS